MKHIRKKLETKENAYFTVEAALILPIAMLFMTVMIFMAFYSYDRCIIEQSAYEAALRGAKGSIEDAQEAYNIALLAAKRLTEDGLFAIKDLAYDAEVTADSVIVTYSGAVNMPFLAWLGEYIDDLDFSISASGEAKRIRQAQEIRLFRIVNGKGLGAE